MPARVGSSASVESDGPTPKAKLMKYAYLLLTALAFGQPLEARAQTGERIIEITNPEFRAFPLAVSETKNLDRAELTAPMKEITEVLRWDLDTSLLFRVLNPKSHLADPVKEPMVASAIDFESWLNIGAEGLIKAAALQVSTRLTVDFRFYDVTSGRELLQKRYEGRPEEARALAHRFANDVVEKLTGKPGIFTTQILSVRKTRKGREIWLCNMDGTNPRPVTKNGSINMLPAWYPDGRRFLFTSFLARNPNLYVASVDKGAASLLSGRQGLNTGGAVSPDGRLLALTLTKDGNSEVYVQPAEGKGLKRLTNHWAIDSSPSWSPSGRRIAFVSARWGDPHVFVMNADGSDVQRVTERGTYNQTPDWSPRGDLIAFTARDERNVFDIFTVDPKTKEIRRLTQDQGNNEEPSFSPDGNHVVFISTRTGKSELWIMGVDGSNQKQISQGGGYLTPAWSPYPAR